MSKILLCVCIHTYMVKPLYSNKAGSLQKAFYSSRGENCGLFPVSTSSCSAGEFFMQSLTAVKLFGEYSSIRISQFKNCGVLFVF